MSLSTFEKMNEIWAEAMRPVVEELLICKVCKKTAIEREHICEQVKETKLFKLLEENK